MYILDLRITYKAQEQSAEKPLSTTERNSLLIFIGLIAKDDYKDDLNKPYTLANKILKAADLAGIKVICDDTIVSKLKDAEKILIDKS